jgi:hypothetical protein
LIHRPKIKKFRNFLFDFQTSCQCHHPCGRAMHTEFLHAERSDTANRDINDLVKRGILAKDAAGGRSTSYSLTESAGQTTWGLPPAAPYKAKDKKRQRKKEKDTQRAAAGENSLAGVPILASPGAGTESYKSKSAE